MCCDHAYKLLEEIPSCPWRWCLLWERKCPRLGCCLPSSDDRKLLGSMPNGGWKALSPILSCMLSPGTWNNTAVSKFYKSHHSSKPIQDTGHGVILPTSNHSKTQLLSPAILNPIITCYHFTSLWENESPTYTQNISIRVGNCLYISSDNFPYRTSNYPQVQCLQRCSSG